MPRRRPVETRTREQVRRTMFSNAIEALEPRTLLTTITDSGILEYKDATNQIVRVAFHNVQAELVFARVNANTNEVVLGDHTPSFAMEDGKDLFTIYVADAGADSFITVAEVPGVMTPVRPMMPFQGNVSLTIIGPEGLQAVSTAGGSGSIYLGAKTRDTPANIANEVNRPILSDQFFGLGILGPRVNGRLTAGLITESGVDLGKFYWAGAISGQVTLGGSVDTFYAGALLTGDTRGQGSFTPPVIPDNFLVNGDIRDLIVMGSVGTHAGSNNGEPIYTTGFDMLANGTIGRVQSYGSIIGNIRAQNDPAFARLRMNQHEIESKVLPGNRGSLTQFEGTDERDFDFGDPNAIGQPRLGDNQGEFFNDTFDTPQLLGTFNSRTLGNHSIQVNGRLQNIPQIQDRVDFYGVPLLAGQTISIRLSAPFSFFGQTGIEDIPSASLNVFDPDGRFVGSDLNNVTPAATLNKLFQFTADRPGTYRFSVNAVISGVILLANIDYQLQIQRAGAMSIGAIAAAGEIFNEGSNSIFFNGQSSFHAVAGDLGVVSAGSTIAFNTIEQPFGLPDIFVDGGNLRVVDAAQLGFVIDGVIQQGPNLGVYGGSIGLVRARTGVNNISSAVINDTKSGIGGDLQMAEAPNNTLFINLFADGGVGVIRAQNMATEPGASQITVNADQIGADGVIDLIDVTGNLGTLGAGGPGITTGPGGNVRYMHVGGVAFRDRFFGGGAPDDVNYAPGERVSFTDDSGTQMLLVPAPDRRFNPDGTPAVPGALNIIQYGIRDKGGNVLINLTSTRGVEVVANGQSGRGTAEIGEINANGLGTLVVDDTGFSPLDPEDDELELDTTAATSELLDVTFEGNAVTDVYEIVGGNFTSIINATGGEIVNVVANSIGELVANSLGLSKSSTGTLVAGNTVFDTTPAQVGPTPDAGPFSQQRIGIRVTGDIVSARANQGVGNFIVDGSIQELIANADGRFTSGVHEGINAPIMTRPGGVATAGGGEIRFVNIGEGILPGGTGEVIFAGLFAHSRIREIVNQGEGSDIRGDIVSKGQNLPTFQQTLPDGTILLQPVAPIGTISLGDGAILGADIMVVLDFENAREINGGPITTPNFGEFNTQPAFEIEAIGLSGKGGIMSANITASDIGRIEVKNGFGILNTSFNSVAQGDMGNIITDGYGIRSTVFDGGGSLRSLQARGNGARVATTNYTSSVRLSERMQFDPYSGYVLSELNDLHRYFGTTAAAPVVTQGDFGRSGIIYDVSAIGARDLGTVTAQQIKSSNFDFASSTNQIIVRDYIDTLLISSGRLNFVQTGGDVHNADWNIAGPVGVVGIGGTWRGTSRLAANGPNGQINTFATGRSMYGTVISANDIALLRVGTDFGAPGFFNVQGQRTSAGIDVGRNLNSLVVKGSLLDGSTIFVDDHLGFITLGGDLQEGGLVSVETLGGQQIGGQVFGEFEIRSQN